MYIFFIAWTNVSMTGFWRHVLLHVDVGGVNHCPLIHFWSLDTDLKLHPGTHVAHGQVEVLVSRAHL